MQEIKQQIEQLLSEKLGSNFPFSVSIYKYFSGVENLKIFWSCSTKTINEVRGQEPQAVSLSLNSKLELKPQIFGGNGGRSIYRKPNRGLREEKYLYMQSIVLPFRTPKPEIDKVLACLSKFVESYKNALVNNIDTLMYQEMVDYKKILNLK
jgi:hypothetical protein